MRILVIEDQELARVQTEKLIRKVFPKAIVHGVDTIAGGLELLNRAAEEKRLYDVAIIDFELPYELGHAPTISVEIPKQIQRIHKSTYIIYITAYIDDPRVDRHVREYHSETGHPATVISKLSTDDLWTNTLIQKLKTHLYQRKISNRMARLFKESTYSSVRFRTDYSSSISVTYELASLIQDIIKYWEYLDEHFKRILLAKFEIDETEQPIKVRLR